MNKRNSILILLAMVSGMLWAQSPAFDPQWELVWSDEFDSLNLKRWLRVDYGIHRHSPDQLQEAQLYMAENVTAADGNLVITMRNKRTRCPNPPTTVWGGCTPCEPNKRYRYTSGRVESATPTYDTQYGFIEARVKLPYDRSFFPAFWAYLGTSTPNPHNAAEIDIFEMTGNLPPSVLTTNIHPVGFGCTDCSKEDFYQQIAPFDFNYTDWHNYGVEWSRDTLIWYVDDLPVRSLHNPGIVDPVKIIFNFALLQGELPDANTPLPAEMRVDYIRVWKIKED
jgi:beta-glucanase (GH16 family)